MRLMKAQHSETFLSPILFFAIFFVAIFFIFPNNAFAEERCIRGGNGECVELKVDSTPGGSGQAKYMLGGSLGKNVVMLADGTKIAAVATYKQKFNTIVRYEIKLYKSTDGVFWSEASVANQNNGWYVDEVLGGSSSNGASPYLGAEFGAGFLGYSLGVSEGRTNDTRLYLARSMACSQAISYTGTAFNDAYDPTRCDSFAFGWVDSTMLFDVISYIPSTGNFSQLQQTKIIGRTQSLQQNNPYNCRNHPTLGVNQECFGALLGVDHPSVDVGLYNGGSQFDEVFVSYNEYHGDGCQASRTSSGGGYDRYNCADQNNLAENPPKICERPSNAEADNTCLDDVRALWSRKITVANDGTLTSSTSDNVNLVEVRSTNSSGFPDFDERHAYYSSTIVAVASATPTSYPLVLYSYSKNSESLKMKYYKRESSSWSTEETVQNLVDWGNISNGLGGNIVGVVDKSNGASSVVADILPAMSTSKTTTNGQIAHLVAYAKVSGTPQTATPVMLRMILYAGGSETSWDHATNPMKGMVLTSCQSQSNCTAAHDPVFNTDKKVFVEAGGPVMGTYNVSGPSIGLYVVLPAAPTTSFSLANTEIYYAKIYVPPCGSGCGNWVTGAYDATMFEVGSNVYFPDYYRLTDSTDANFPTTAPLSPIIPSQLKFASTTYTSSYLRMGNTFHPSIFFVRAKNDVSQKCSNTNPCSVSFANEPKVYGIQGWAWASTVGWISLSCNNLNTCYKANATYSSSSEGSPYGVRVVVDSSLPKKPLKGRAWSERVGWLSFDRADSISANNPCGNPPNDATFSFVNNNYCAILTTNINDTQTTSIFIDFLDPAKPLSDFPDFGTLLIDDELIKYVSVNDATGELVGAIRANNLPNEWIKTTPRTHAQNTPVFLVYQGDDVTFNSHKGEDIYRGISNYDTGTFEVTGWARALSWIDYQTTYCPTGVGPGYPPPCDKQWGWVKLSGSWATVNRGKFSGTCNTPTASLTSVDGYPPGPNERLQFGTTNIAYTYNSINATLRTITMAANLPIGIPCTTWNNVDVSWVTVTSAAVATTDTSIPVDSVTGFLPKGKAQFGTLGEVFTYANIDVGAKRLINVTRGSGPVAIASGTIVKPYKESGIYSTFVSPLGLNLAESTLIGFAWSSPNTDSPSADPLVPRYQNNVSGFGWINFQPNKLLLIYPYVRTLFNNIYVGGDVGTSGPPSPTAITPSQFGSTYLIQKTGIISTLENVPAFTSGAFEQCMAKCTGPAPDGYEHDAGDCSTLTVPEYCGVFNPANTADPIQPDTTASEELYGALPDREDLITWTSHCKKVDETLVSCPGFADQANLIAPDEPALVNVARDQQAASGLNKFGHRVVLCRANPTLGMSSDGQLSSGNVFRDNGYNPPECDWQSSTGWRATFTGFDYDVGQDVCLKDMKGLFSTSGTIRFGTQTRAYTPSLLNPAADCPAGSTHVINIASPALSPLPAVNDAIVEEDLAAYQKVNVNLSLDPEDIAAPLIYTLPEAYGDDPGSSYGLFMLRGTPMQFNNAPVVNGVAKSGAVTLLFPGSIFLLDSSSRYCPQGVPKIPCKAPEDLAYDATTNPLGTKVTSIRQLASAGFIIPGSYANLPGGFYTLYHYPDIKSYQVGAYMVTGENDKWSPYGLPGVFNTQYLLGQNVQINIQGLVFAKAFLMYGDYFEKDSNNNLVAPAESFVYDGRASANPPPGFADVVAGLPKIQQATP